MTKVDIVNFALTVANAFSNNPETTLSLIVAILGLLVALKSIEAKKGEKP